MGIRTFNEGRSNIAGVANCLHGLKVGIGTWAYEQMPLAEAVCLALTLHILLLPVMWLTGWLLPWPKSPVVTTVIELDLSNWPHEARPDKVFEMREPKLNQLH